MTRLEEAVKIIDDCYKEISGKSIKNQFEYVDMEDIGWLVAGNSHLVNYIKDGMEYHDKTISYVVLSVVLEDNSEVFVKFDGNYDSWNGTNWIDDPYLVEEKEVTIKKYVRVK